MLEAERVGMAEGKEPEIESLVETISSSAQALWAGEPPPLVAEAVATMVSRKRQEVDGHSTPVWVLSALEVMENQQIGSA